MKNNEVLGIITLFIGILLNSYLIFTENYFAKGMGWLVSYGLISIGIALCIGKRRI